jgi:hypothetical protein
MILTDAEMFIFRRLVFSNALSSICSNSRTDSSAKCSSKGQSQHIDLGMIAIDGRTTIRFNSFQRREIPEFVAIEIIVFDHCPGNENSFQIRF